jgi:hypothetical protein
MLAPQDQTGGRSNAASSAAGWLGLAAAPTFAIMALLTGIQSRNMPDMLCSATQGALPLTGMVSMYLLMGAFHSTSWLKLLSADRIFPSTKRTLNRCGGYRESTD